jgi:ABC-2 type transport system permease protein/oleandomycin transport system permease protein
MTSIIEQKTQSNIMKSVKWLAADTLTITKRNLISYTRIPQALFFSTLQPVMFVLLFRYVFGSAIPIKGVQYVNYLIPGIFVQTVLFGSVSTGIGLAEDLQKGIIERFKALPMSKMAVLMGRTIADLVRNILVVIIISGVGFAVGFRIQTSVVSFVAALLLLLLFSFAISWGFTIVGLTAPNSETAQVMSFPLIFPLTFASSAFVPVATMPTWLREFATYQPVSVLVDASRKLMVNFPANVSNWSSVESIFWSLGAVVVLLPLAVYKFSKTA